MSNNNSAPATISEDLRNSLLINIGISGTLGLFFNVLIAFVLIKKIRKGGAHEDIKLCTFVAFTDVLVSMLLIMRALFAKYPYNIYKEHPYWCKFDAGFTTQLLVYSGYSLGVMSIERFLLVCFNIKLSVIIWFTLIGLAWGSQFTLVWISIPQGLQILTRTETQCTFLPQKIGYYTYILALFYFFSSFICVIVSYCAIMVVKFRQCLNQINLNIPKAQVYTELRSTFAKSIINIFLYLLVFSGKVYVAVYEVVTGQKRTIAMDIYSNATIVYSVIVNALILLYMNQEVRKSFVQLLRDIKCSIIE